MAEEKFTTDTRLKCTMRLEVLHVSEIGSWTGSFPAGNGPPYLGDISGPEGHEEIWDGDRWVPISQGNSLRYSIEPMR